MWSYLKIIAIAAFISLVGSLPLGALNMTAFQITIAGSISGAVLFSLAAILIELVYARISLMKILQFNRKWSVFIPPVLAIVLVVLGVNSITSVNHQNSILTSSVILFPFIAGLTMSALNPMQIPFWTLWNNVMNERRIFENMRYDRFFYMAGIAIGSALSFAFFIVLALKFKTAFTKYLNDINTIIGTLYIMFALVLTIRMMLVHKKKFSTNS